MLAPNTDNRTYLSICQNDNNSAANASDLRTKGFYETIVDLGAVGFDGYGESPHTAFVKENTTVYATNNFDDATWVAARTKPAVIFFDRLSDEDSGCKEFSTWVVTDRDKFPDIMIVCVGETAKQTRDTLIKQIVDGEMVKHERQGERISRQNVAAHVEAIFGDRVIESCRSAVEIVMDETKAPSSLPHVATTAPVLAYA